MSNNSSLFQRLRDTKGWKTFIFILRIILAFDVLLVVLLVFGNTVSRYLLKTSFIWVEEILIICALWMYFLGSILGAEEESHIKGDMITGSIKNLRTKKWVLVAVALVTAVTSIYFAILGVEYVALQSKLNMLTAYLKLPKLTSQSAVGIGLVGMAFFWVFHLFRYLTINPDDLAEQDEETTDIITNNGEGEYK